MISLPPCLRIVLSSWPSDRDITGSCDRPLLHPQRPGIGVQRCACADRHDQLLLDMTEREAGDCGDGEGAEAVAEDFFEAEAGAFDASVAAAAEDDAGYVVEQAAEG